MKNKHTLLYGVPLAAIAIIFTTTNPSTLPAVGIAIVLILLAFLFYGLFSRLLHFVAARTLSDNKQRLLSVSMTGVVGLMLVLQSTGQLTLRDFISAMAIFAIGWLYVSRFSLQRSP